MCVVSMVADHWNQRLEPYQPYTQPVVTFAPNYQEQINNLRKEIDHMIELMRKAKIYDERNNEPECETEEKMATLRALAAAVGIDLDEVLKTQQ